MSLPLFFDLSPDAKEMSLAVLSKLSLALSNLTAFEAPGDCLLSTSEAVSPWFSFGADSWRLFGLSVLFILFKTFQTRYAVYALFTKLNLNCLLKNILSLHCLLGTLYTVGLPKYILVKMHKLHMGLLAKR